MSTYLLKRHDVRFAEFELANHWNSIVGLWIADVVALETVERHESHPTGLFLVHDVQELASGLLVVDYDVEQTATRSAYCAACSLAILTCYQLWSPQRPCTYR